MSKSNLKHLESIKENIDKTDTLSHEEKSDSMKRIEEWYAEDQAWDEQPISIISQWVGPGGPLFQAIKKARESMRLLKISGPERARQEILGAIAYLAQAAISLKEMEGTEE